MDSAPKMITLKSSDSQEFEVEEAVVLQSQTIKNLVEDDCAKDAIPLLNVTGSILAKVIKYCKAYHDKKEEDKELKEFDTEFLKDIEQPVLFELIHAANFLNIKGLLDITCQSVADMIKDKKPEEIRKIFNITNDFTPEEEAEVRQENQWAFE